MKKANRSLTKRLLSTLLLVGAIFFNLVSNAAAQTLDQRIQGIANATNEEDFTNGVIMLSIPVGVIALIGLSISAVYTMITSQGNPEKINEARDIFQNAVLGFVLVVLSVSILLIFQSITGVQI